MAIQTSPPDLAAIRARFPALEGDTVFLENAGGSQVPTVVADRIRTYMLESYVQLGAPYALSRRCTEIVDQGHAFVRTLLGGDGHGYVVLGASCSALCRMLADAYAEVLEPGDEIVLAENGHEANVGPWLRLERLGATIRWWKVDPTTGASSLESLDRVLSDRTKIVAFPHVSNLLGEILDVEAVTKRAHAVGARVVVDGVAYVPHRAVDVGTWDVDYYVYSTYKVYGPHAGALFGKTDAFDEIPDPNHFFVAKSEMPYRFELGGVSHEACAGLTALGSYFAFLAGHASFTRDTVTAAATVWADLEQPLQSRLVSWLNDHPRARIVGPDHAGPDRVPTVSFLHADKTSARIARAATSKGFGVRNGHMYAYRLCEAMGIDPTDGVVRVSAVHYNTPDEIERLIEVFDEVM